MTNTYTVFYAHPFYGSGSYVTERDSAATAGIEAADMLSEDMTDYCLDEGDADDTELFGDYECELSMIRDDLDVRVYAGDHVVGPARIPDWEFE
jgi:hypothetical protein